MLALAYVWCIVFNFFSIYCLVVSSEGSVIAYYLSEFRVPAHEEAAVDEAIASMGKAQRSITKSDSLAVDDMVSSGRVEEPGIQTAVCCDFSPS